MHMQVIVIEINVFCKDFLHQLSIWDSEGIHFNNEMCYVVKSWNVLWKMPLSIEIYVLCNSLATCMDITETYDMIGLQFCMC